VKIFYSESSLFIGARGGGVLRTRLDSTVAWFPEDACPRVHSDVPRVTFSTKIQRFSWNRIVGVNPLPRGVSVGEFRKNLSPSKRRV
jgi:hypothetical protein